MSVTEEVGVKMTPPVMSMVRRTVQVVCSLLLICLAIYELWQLGKLFFQILDAEGVLRDTLAVNKWLASMIDVGIAGGLVWCITAQVRAMKEGAEVTAVKQVLLGAVACGFFGLVYWLQKDVSFNHTTGEAMKYYGASLDGTIEIYSARGFDPRTGGALKPVTPDIAFAYQQQKAGKSPQPLSPKDVLQRAFDGTTGAPKVWFARRPDGGFALYDRPGFDGYAGVALEPITLVVLGEVRDWQARVESGNRRREAAAVRENAARARRDEDARAAVERQAFIDRFVEPRPRRVSGVPNIAVRLIGVAGAPSAPVASVVVRTLHQRGINVVPLFKAAAGTEGIDRQLYEGNPSLAERLSLAEHCDSLLIGAVRVVSGPRRAGGMYITEMALAIRRISAVDGSVNDEIEVRGKGGALDASSSVSAAVERLSENAEAALKAWPST
jgi:hypothetical protein